MADDRPDKPTIITVECLRGHTREVLFPADLQDDVVRDAAKRLLCPQCGSKVKILSDDEVWIICSKPHHADDHGTPPDMQ